MSWLKRKIRNWLEDYSEPGDIQQKLTVSRDVESRICDADPILQFRIFGAVGGKVVEFRRYDRKTDRSDTTSYIITNDQDFGERISKIATMESLKA